MIIPQTLERGLRPLGALLGGASGQLGITRSATRGLWIGVKNPGQDNVGVGSVGKHLLQGASGREDVTLQFRHACVLSTRRRHAH